MERGLVELTHRTSFVKPDDPVAMQRSRSKAKPGKLSSSVMWGHGETSRPHAGLCVCECRWAQSMFSFARVVRAWNLNAFVVNNV